MAEEVTVMRRLITLRTDGGKRFYVRLDNLGSGIDRLYRRWSREPDGWHCVDTGEIAQVSGLIFKRRPKSASERWRN